MPYDKTLEERLDKQMIKRRDFYKQKMFGGVGYLLHGNMCFGIWQDQLILRLGQSEAEVALQKKNVVPFDITGRPMKGWIMVTPAGMQTEVALRRWLSLAIAFISQLPSK